MGSWLSTYWSQEYVDRCGESYVFLLGVLSKAGFRIPLGECYNSLFCQGTGYPNVSLKRDGR